MADQELFDFAGEDVFAATNNHFLEATNDINITTRIHCCQVPRVQPSLAIDGFGGLLRHVVVSIHDQVAPAAQFPALATRRSLTRSRVDDFDLAVRQRHAYRGRFQFKRVVLQRQRDSRAGFRLAKDNGDAGTHPLLHLFHEIDGYR